MLLATAGASTASAATPLGEAFTPTIGCGPSTFIESTSPGNSYAAPFPGVITSWSYQAPTPAPSHLRLKLARAAGGNSFLIVGQSDLESPTAGALNTYPTRITAQAGDFIGLYQDSFTDCAGPYTAGYVAYARVSTDVQPSDTPSTFSQDNGLRLTIAASLEPDADHDGFGDETQDACPSNAATQAPCSVKKKKCKRKKKRRAAEVAKKKRCKKRKRR